MERLTRYFYENEPGMDCTKCSRRKSGKCNSSADCAIFAAERLSAIEDILGDDYDLDRLRELVAADRKGRFVKDNGKWTLRKCLTNGIDTERLMEICNAEQEGRCLVLPPLKIGDTAYFLLQNDIYAATVFLIQWERRKGYEDNGIIWADGVLGTKSANIKDFGKTVFSNYFAANDALKRGLKDGM